MEEKRKKTAVNDDIIPDAEPETTPEENLGSEG